MAKKSSDKSDKNPVKTSEKSSDKTAAKKDKKKDKRGAESRAAVGGFRVKAKQRPAGHERFSSEPKEIAVFDPDNVEKVLEQMPPAEQIERAAMQLQALAHPNRVQALLALSSSELCVGDMAAVLQLSLSATSTMLKQLRALGFVSTRHAGKQTYYRAQSTLPKVVLDTLFRIDAQAG